MATSTITRPASLDEFFRLLSHPNMIVMTSVMMSVALLLGHDASHPLLQTCGILWLAALTARGLTATQSKLVPLCGALSLLAIFVGLKQGYQSSGSLSIEPGRVTEAYQRGQGVAVDYHLGGPLRMDLAGDKAQFRLGDEDQLEVELRTLAKGSVISLGPWRLSLEKREPSQGLLIAEIGVKPRSGDGAERVVRLIEGQSTSIDGQTLITAKGISRNRGGSTDPLLGPAVELAVKWGESEERGWHYLTLPDLSTRFGTAPVITEVRGVSIGERFHFTVQRRTSQGLIWVGIFLLALSVLLWFPTATLKDA